MSMKPAVRITVTGAAGQIGYALLFRIAAGEFLGKDQPVVLQLLEIPPALPALDGVVMELDDCAFTTLAGVVTTSDADVAFRDADFAFLVGAKPRGPGMERADLLLSNAEIFNVQGRALNDHASRDVKVLVIGNPANTNALITMKNAPDLDPRQVMAMMRLDHNRGLAMLAAQVSRPVDVIRKLTVWGKSFHHAIPGSPPYSGGWETGHGNWSNKAGMRMNLSPEWQSAALKLSRPGAPPAPRPRQTPSWIIPVTGYSEPVKMTGQVWLWLQMVVTAFRRALSIPSRLPVQMVVMR